MFIVVLHLDIRLILENKMSVYIDNFLKKKVYETTTLLDQQLEYMNKLKRAGNLNENDIEDFRKLVDHIELTAFSLSHELAELDGAIPDEDPFADIPVVNRTVTEIGEL